MGERLEQIDSIKELDSWNKSILYVPANFLDIGTYAVKYTLTLLGECRMYSFFPFSGGKSVDSPAEDRETALDSPHGL